MAGSLQFIQEFEVTGTVQTLDCDNIFSDRYDVYYLTVALKESSAGNDQWIRIRLIDNTGTVITASEYDYAQLTLIANTTFSELKGTGQAQILYGGIGYSDDTGNGGGLYVINPNDSSSYTFLQAQSGSTVGGTLYGGKAISVHKSAETIRGINFHTTAFWGSGTVRVYGLASN
tara:strand:+ start:243 stop:764 length:522 start_codon:yes stop_codon:yes gene_type:complete